MPERRWRVKKSLSKPNHWYASCTLVGLRAPEPGSAVYFERWSGAMGYANLQAWLDRGGVIPSD